MLEKTISAFLLSVPLFKAELVGYVIIRSLQIAFIVHPSRDVFIRQYALKQRCFKC